MEKELSPVKALLQTADTQTLLKAVNGEIDLNELAKEELASALYHKSRSLFWQFVISMCTLGLAGLTH